MTVIAGYYHNLRVRLAYVACCSTDCLRASTLMDFAVALPFVATYWKRQGSVVPSEPSKHYAAMRFSTLLAVLVRRSKHTLQTSI